MHFKDIIDLSRPRFWIYELGTFFIGVIVAAPALSVLIDPLVLVFALYFMFPANLFIYGVNDIFDYATDKLNPKKVEYESLLEPRFHKKTWIWISVTNLPFLLLTLLLPFSSSATLLVFLFFAGFYSAKPIRAKTKPFLDSFFSAGHYIATGVFGYFLAGGNGLTFPLLGILGGLAWAMAMHAYSAIPDIKADQQAGLATIATFLGRRWTLYVCALLYAAAGIFFFQTIGIFALIAMIAYLTVIVFSLRAKNAQSFFRIYTYFPLLNTIVPMIWSIGFMIQKFS